MVKKINKGEKILFGQKITLSENNIKTKSVSPSRLVYLYLDKLHYSPLAFEHYRKKLEENGFIVTKNLGLADIILSSYLSVLQRYKSRGKKYLLWTHEPYHNFIYTPTLRLGGQHFTIMNVYTNNVFTHNYRYFHFKDKLDLLTEENFPQFRDPTKTVIAFSTKYPKSYYEKNKYSILDKRYDIINWGWRKKLLKVWGKGWGKMGSGNSRDSNNREAEKAEILANHDFNVALENTSVRCYVTEKIWESLASGCLPIYYGNSSIYKDFPKKSFIDYRKVNNPSQLFRYISKMTIDEYRYRMNKCITVFNRLVDEVNEKQEKSIIRFSKCPKNTNIETVDYEKAFQHFQKKLISIST